MLEGAENGKINLSLSVSTDGGNFLRQTCPSCGLDFKTEVDRAGLAHLLAPQIERVGQELGVRTDLLAGETGGALTRCPYCGFAATHEELMTDELESYVEGVVNVMVVRPSLDNLFGTFADGLNFSGGFASMKTTYHRPAPSPEPVHGPEPPDLVAVFLACCKKRVKVLEAWRHFDRCPYCSTAIVVE